MYTIPITALYPLCVVVRTRTTPSFLSVTLLLCPDLGIVWACPSLENTSKYSIAMPFVTAVIGLRNTREYQVGPIACKRAPPPILYTIRLLDPASLKTLALCGSNND